jgi:hypothetical protein
MRIAALVLVFFILLSPDFQVAARLPVVRAEDGIILVFLIALCLAPRRCLRKLPPGHHDKISIAILIMGGMAFLSICFSALRNPIVVNDFMVLPMLLKYWLIYKMAQSLAEPRARLYCLYALVAAVGLSAVVGILQFHSAGGIGNWLSARYEWGAAQQMDPEELEAALANRRVGGTHGDPRYFGYLLVAGLGACASLWLYLRRGTGRLLAICVAPLCLVALIYTASRTAMLGLVIVAILAVIIQQRTRGINAKALIAWGLLAIVGLSVFVGFLTTSFKERVFRTDTDSYETSVHARKRDFIRPFSQALEDPAMILVGKGPSKAVLRSSSHNDIGWHFQHFGLPGLAAYLFLIGFGLKRAWLVLKSCPPPAEGALHLAALLVLVVWALFIMAESIFKDAQIMALNMFMLGLLAPAPAAVPAALRFPARQRLKTMSVPAGAIRRVPWPRPQRPFAMRRAPRITGPWARRVGH